MFYYYLIFLLVFLTIARPLTTLLHELGHGILALFLTNKKVTLYIGSYGDPKDSYKLVLGRLEIFFKKDTFHWKIGLCVPEDNSVSVNRRILIYVMGPLASLFLTLILIYIVVFNNELNEDIKVFLFFFSLSTLFDFLINIIPSSSPIKLHSGSIVYNDGKQILELLKWKRMPKEYKEASKFYMDKNYAKAALIYKKVLENDNEDFLTYKYLISSYLMDKNYKETYENNIDYFKKFKKKLTADDYCNSGLAKSFLEKYEEAISDYNMSLEMDPNHTLSLNNRGYTYNLMGEYEKALDDFNKAIELEDNFSYALNNRGFSKIKLGLQDEGLSDLEKSMTIDGKNSYCYMNYGIYHLDNKEYEKALKYFNKAQELDNKTYQLDAYLEAAKEKLNN